MEEHKLTMSFINGNPGFVVKADNAQELDALIKEALPRFKAFKSAVDTYREKQQRDATPPPQETPICAVHNSQMSWKPPGVSKKTNKPYQGFWACPVKNPDGSFCNYKPE